jgi:hypothetical protein
MKGRAFGRVRVHTVAACAVEQAREVEDLGAGRSTRGGPVRKLGHPGTTALTVSVSVCHVTRIYKMNVMSRA